MKRTIYRLWYRLPNGSWAPLELVCSDVGFMTNVMKLYADYFLRGDQANLELREEES